MLGSEVSIRVRPPMMARVSAAFSLRFDIVIIVQLLTLIFVLLKFKDNFGGKLCGAARIISTSKN